jgi:hypothetical protein
VPALFDLVGSTATVFKLFTRKQRRVQVMLDQYLNHWIGAVNAFQDAWSTFLELGVGEAFDYKVEYTHKEESRADDLRRKIELELYGKALLPESRGDILGLLETVDRLLTEAEWVLYELQLQEMVIPDKLKERFRALVTVVCSCCTEVHKSLKVMFVETADAPMLSELTDAVDALESESDHLERGLIRTIFKLDISAGEKILLKELVMRLGAVTDRAENVSNRITLASVKRRV